VEVLVGNEIEGVQVAGRRVTRLGPRDVEADHARVPVPHCQLGDLHRAGRLSHGGDDEADREPRAFGPAPQTIKHGADGLIEGQSSIGQELRRHAHLGVHDPVVRQVLAALARNPLEPIACLHDRHRVAKSLQVELERLAVRTEREPLRELIGIGGRKLAVAGIRSKLDHRARSQAAVEVIVEQHLRHAADGVEVEGRCGRALHAPMVPARVPGTYAGRLRKAGTIQPMRRSIPTANAILILALALAACGSSDPNPSTSPVPTSTETPEPSPTLTPEPTPTPVPEVEVPLAVVTGYINATAAISLTEVEAAMATMLVHCDVVEVMGQRRDDTECSSLPENEDALGVDPELLALLPPSAVVPTLKVLPVDGADLFGNAEARELSYPITGRAVGVEAHDPAQIRTLISLGDSCPDRGVAFAAITQGRGWDWVFGGGTAAYRAVFPNPVGPGQVGNGFNIVDAVRTGNEGAVAELVSAADVTLDDFECPVVDNFTVNDGVVFSIDPAVLPRLRDTYGVDVATLAANHLFDRGTPGFLETLAQFEAAGIPTTGAGPDLDAAMEPVFLEVSGLTFGFVAFNEIPGSLEAGPGQPGVLWLRDDNVREAVTRARAGADLVFCVPQWWGGAEYHAKFIGDMRRQQELFFEAGCDHVIGHGTHWSGPIEITPADDGDHRVTMVSHGNFLFGQEWSQQTQEGVILELAFRGTELAQARMHPYIMLEQAQTNLTDPETDGRYVLDRIYEASGLCCGAAP